MAPIALDHVEKVCSGGVKALDELKLEVKEGLAGEQTWSPTELMVGEAPILCRDELTPPSGYRPLPNVGEGLNERIAYACRRLLDACLEIDRADIVGVGDSWKPVGYMSMVWPQNHPLRRHADHPSIRRNIAYQAVVGRMRTAEISQISHVRSCPRLPVRACGPAVYVCSPDSVMLGIGYLSWLPARRFPDMIIDCAHYQNGRRRDEGPVPLQEAVARCGQGGFVWLGLLEPGDDELAQVRDTFGLHELAVEDAQNFHMRPKLENYDQGVQLVILRTARYDDVAEAVEFGEISVFIAPAFVITVRQGVASELRGARQRLEHRPELLATGSSAVLWAILDQVVDDYAPVVAGLERDIDQVEATVFSGASAPTERIYSLRREATDFYRAVHPLLAVVTAIERGTEAPQLQPYMRDVQDHLLLVNEEVAAQRDLLGTILEANMAVISVEQTNVSVRQNATVEQLTILATVFLPLTFVTGFFGQNFGWLVRHQDSFTAFAIYGIGGLVVPLTLLAVWLRFRTAHTATAAALDDR